MKWLPVPWGSWRLKYLLITPNPSISCPSTASTLTRFRTGRRTARKIDEENSFSLPVAAECNRTAGFGGLNLWFLKEIHSSLDLSCSYSKAPVDDQISCKRSWVGSLTLCYRCIVDRVSNPGWCLFPLSSGEWKIRWQNTNSPFLILYWLYFFSVILILWHYIQWQILDWPPGVGSNWTILWSVQWTFNFDISRQSSHFLP